MAAVQPVKVFVVFDRTLDVQCSKECTAEELCIILCKKYNIPPLTRTLFALRIRGTDHFLKDNRRVLDSTRDYELRIRFKVPKLSLLITLDETTFDYYFRQSRNDVNDSKIPEIKYLEHKQALLGLGIVDMARAVLEDDLPQREVENSYKKYVPKVIVKRHGLFGKKYAHEYLPRLCAVGHSVNYLKSMYLQELYALAPNYLAEECDSVLWNNGEEVVPVRLVVAPFHHEMPGVRLYNTRERDWFHVCTIEELIYLTRNGACSLEVSRRGTPLFFKFKNEEQLSSFISVCDGYYRLMVKWTFNLSKDDETPSLKDLQRIKCHGPVGGAFSYRKLDEKRAKNHGCYILRQCQEDYNVYYLDVCTKNRTTETYRIEYKGHCWLFNNLEYDRIQDLVSSHQKPDERIFLNECIPPSEYDKSQLLLCGEPQKTGVRVEQAELQEILKDNKSPRCLLNKDILLYTGLPCIPWIENEIVETLGKKKSELIENVNYCRNMYRYAPGPWCFVRSNNVLLQESCKLRECNAMACKVAGTANDYAGSLTVTRSNRTCMHWANVGFRGLRMYHDVGVNAMYPEGKVEKANNYCRNPTRSIGGAWCFTIDALLDRDLCNVQDCDKYESHIILSNHTDSLGYTFILPEWKHTGSEKIGSENLTTTYKALWKLDETKKLVVAFKSLQKDKANDYLKDFIELANRWACVHSSAIVRLYGITLSSPTALVLEYLPYGPFDVYLKENKDKVNDLQLLKVSAGLARALWDLSESGVVHGDIRCRRLLLAARHKDHIVVKLSGPTIRRYTPRDVHWIPVDFIADMSMARRSVLGDIWAFATTLWEVYSYGQSPADTNPVLTAKSYEKGTRLWQPARCPREVWALLLECWSTEPLRPQAIMRDMNRLLHMEYVPAPGYSICMMNMNDEDTGTVTSSERLSEPSDAGSHKSLISDNSLPSMNGTITTEYDNAHSMDNHSLSSFENRFLVPSSAHSPCLAPQDPPEEPSSFEPSLMESITSQGKTYLVTKTSKRIGTGNYGQVHEGIMESDSDSDKSNARVVAIKTLTRQSFQINKALYKDFRNEMEIMKSLHHDHIVEILGFSDTGPEVLIVMEYLQEGSLYHYLKFNTTKLRVTHLLKYALDIASGMDYISAKGIVHRDLATRNILVVNKSKVKITDFGLARIIPKEESEYRVSSPNALPLNWYAPEAAVKPWIFSVKSDVWSYGVTVWEVFTHAGAEVPKFDVTRPKERAACFSIPKDCKEDIYRDLMVKCWSLDPERRPRFIDLVIACKSKVDEYRYNN